MKYQFQEKFSKDKRFRNLGSSKIKKILGDEYEHYHRYTGRGRPRKITGTKEEYVKNFMDTVDKTGYLQSCSFTVRLKNKYENKRRADMWKKFNDDNG